MKSSREIPRQRVLPRWYRKISVLGPLELYGLFAVVFLLVLALIGPYIAPYPTETPDPTSRLIPPSKEHLLGTDENGMDVLSRILAAPRVDVSVAFIGIAIAVIVGTPIGVFAGYFEGSDKRIAALLGETTLRVMRQCFREVIIVSNGRRSFDFPRIKVVHDEKPGCGPLMGLYSGLKASPYDINFVTACDMPFINPDLFKMMIPYAHIHDVVVPIVNHLPEPLLAFYHRRVLSPVQETLARDRRKMVAFYDMVRVCEIPEEQIRSIDPELKSFVNINTPDDLSRVQQMLNEENRNSKAPSARRGTSPR